MRRTKSFRVTFAEKIITNDGELANVCPPVTPPHSPQSAKGEDIEVRRSPFKKTCYPPDDPKDQYFQAEDHTSQKAGSPANLTCPKECCLVGRRFGRCESRFAPLPVSFQKSPEPTVEKETSPSSSKGDRRTSLSQFLDQNVLNPMEEKLRQMALKYRKPKEVPKSRIPVPTSSSFKSSRVSSLASKFERQCSANDKI